MSMRVEERNGSSALQSASALALERMERRPSDWPLGWSRNILGGNGFSRAMLGKKSKAAVVEFKSP